MYINHTPGIEADDIELPTSLYDTVGQTCNSLFHLINKNDYLGISSSFSVNSSIYAILWCIWLERNGRIFKGNFSTVDFIWDRVLFRLRSGVVLMISLGGVSLLDLAVQLSGMLCCMTQCQRF